MSIDTPVTAAALGLEPHPEGGWYRRIWAGDHAVQTPGGERPAATCIHYLLTPGESSAWHVVASDEIWLWHGPGRLVLTLGGADAEPGEPRDIVLGPDHAQGELPGALVPAGVWQSARLAGEGEALVSCVVSPGFSFDDWRLAEHP